MTKPFFDIYDSTIAKRIADTASWTEWVNLFPGIDYPREVDWLEIKRIFGGGLMTVGMREEREGVNGG